MFTSLWKNNSKKTENYCPLISKDGKRKVITI